MRLTLAAVSSVVTRITVTHASLFITISMETTEAPLLTGKPPCAKWTAYKAVMIF